MPFCGFGGLSFLLFVERGLIEDLVLLERLLLIVGVATRDKQAVSHAHAALKSENFRNLTNLEYQFFIQPRLETDIFQSLLNMQKAIYIF